MVFLLLLLLVCSSAWAQSEGDFDRYFSPSGVATVEVGRHLGRLTNSDDPADRHRALTIRRAYVGRIYEGAHGRTLAGLPPLEPTDRPLPKPPTFRKPASLDCDYLVIGSGPAGSVIAHQLIMKGHKVVLIERGSFVLPGSMDTRVAGPLKEGGGAVPSAEGRVLVRNAIAVGGGSTVNVDLAFAPTLPSVARRLSAWEHPPTGVAQAYDWVVERIGTRTPALSEINANNRILWDGARGLGLRPALYDLNTGLQGEKRSAVESLLYEAIENGLVLLPDLEARRIEVSQGRVVGVTVRSRAPWNHPAVVQDPFDLRLPPGQERLLSAPRLIVCAGAQGSAALLLRSGLGGESVGRGIVLHPSIPLIGLFDHPINNLEGTPSTVYCEDDELGVIYECMSAGPDYVAMMLLGSGPEIFSRIRRFSHLGGFGVLLVDEPVDSNRVVLDALGEPRVEYRLTESQRARFARGVERAARMMFLAGAREVYVPTTEDLLDDGGPSRGELVVLRPGQSSRVRELRFVSGRTVVTSAHFQSSCKSAVNADFGVHGVEGLYLCDSSVFPTSVGANPMQTVYTVAKLFVDTLP